VGKQSLVHCDSYRVITNTSPRVHHRRVSTPSRPFPHRRFNQTTPTQTCKFFLLIH
jgi:hypothetical protein